MARSGLLQGLQSQVCVTNKYEGSEDLPQITKIITDLEVSLGSHLVPSPHFTDEDSGPGAKAVPEVAPQGWRALPCKSLALPLGSTQSYLAPGPPFCS